MIEWRYDKYTDPDCDHDWNPISGGHEFCPRCSGVRRPVL